MKILMFEIDPTLPRYGTDLIQASSQTPTAPPLALSIDANLVIVWSYPPVI